MYISIYLCVYIYIYIKLGVKLSPKSIYTEEEWNVGLYYACPDLSRFEHSVCSVCFLSQHPSSL